MHCSKCGTVNEPSSKFCAKCGNSLAAAPESVATPTSETAQPTNVAPQPAEPKVEPSVATTSATPSEEKPDMKLSFLGYFILMFNVLLKPITTLKEKAVKLDSFKNSALISAIIAVIATIIKVITTIFTVVKETSYNWETDTTEVVWEWDKINIFQTIGINLLIFLGIIFAIASIYYIASLIAKKQVGYSRLVGITAIAIIPMYLSILLLSPLLTMIHFYLGMGISVIGSIYSIVLIYECLNNEIQLTGNAKCYLNLVCLSIIVIVGAIVYGNMMVSSVSDDLGGLLDMFDY